MEHEPLIDPRARAIATASMIAHELRRLESYIEDPENRFAQVRSLIDAAVVEAYAAIDRRMPESPVTGRIVIDPSA